MFQIEENRLQISYALLSPEELLNLALTVLGLLKSGKDVPFEHPKDLNEYLVKRIVSLQREQKTVEQAMRFLDRYISDMLHPSTDFGMKFDMKYQLFNELVVPQAKDEAN